MPLTVAIPHPVIGYRLWLVREERLCALDGEPWAAGDVAARCREDPAHEAPVPGCGCGLYALHEIPQDVREGMALGAVVAWGALEVHQDGFRAANARPIALSRAGSMGALALAGVAATYGVPLVADSALPAAAAEFGCAVPAQQRPVDELRLLQGLKGAAGRRERCAPATDLLGSPYDDWYQALLARLEGRRPGPDLRSAMTETWEQRPAPRPRRPGLGLARIRCSLAKELQDSPALPKEAAAAMLAALDAAHGPVRESVQSLVARGCEGLVPDRYLLHPDVAPAVTGAARRRARALLKRDGPGLLPPQAGPALLLLEPELEDSEVEHLMLRLRSSHHVERLLDQAHARRPGLAHAALKHDRGFGAMAAAKRLGRASRPLLLRELRRLPAAFSVRRDPAIDAILGDAALSQAAERCLRLARDTTDAVTAIALMAPDQARPHLERLVDRIDGLSSHSGADLRRRTWNAICLRDHLTSALPLEAVRTALRDPTIGLINRTLLLRAHPNADHAAAKHIWLHESLRLRDALDVLQATGPAGLELARAALGQRKRARSDTATACRLSAALVLLAAHPGFDHAAAAVAADPDLPATPRAIACHLAAIPPGPDPAMRRYQRWQHVRQPRVPDPLIDLITGAWQGNVIL